MELVAVRVFNEAKANNDVRELIGLPASGVLATTSTEALLESAPECVIHAGPQGAMEPIEACLEVGVNVISLVNSTLMHPATAKPVLRNRIDAACSAGASTFFYGGIDPGFASHTLPIALSGICERIDLMTVYEVRDYDPLPLHMLDWFHFGRTDTAGAAFFTRGGITRTWSSSLSLIADALGVTIEQFEEFHETEPAPESFEVPALKIAQGTIAAIRFGLNGYVDGVARLRIEHVNRLRRDLAPQWWSRQGYGAEVKGQPNYRLHLDLVDSTGRQTRPALFGTAMYMVNAAPAIIAARPGIVTALDLPLIRGAAVGGAAITDDWTIAQRIRAGEVRI
jgi:4-hydroxy-tetrahydrodipicolinate reductase